MYFGQNQLVHVWKNVSLLKVQKCCLESKSNSKKELLFCSIQFYAWHLGHLLPYSRKAKVKRKRRQLGLWMILNSKLDRRLGSPMRLVLPSHLLRQCQETDHQCGETSSLGIPQPQTQHYSFLRPVAFVGPWSLVSVLWGKEGGTTNTSNGPPLPRGHGKGAFCLNTVLPPSPQPSSPHHHPSRILWGHKQLVN